MNFSGKPFFLNKIAGSHFTCSSCIPSWHLIHRHLRKTQAATRLWEEALRTYLSERGWLLDELDNALPGLENLYSDENPPMDLEYRLEHAESDTHPALVELCRLRRRVQDWSDTIPGKQKDSAFVQLCAYISQVYIHMGKGHSFGIEKELLGGHIACTKRALHDANQALAMLPELENEPYMPSDGIGLWSCRYSRRVTR